MSVKCGNCKQYHESVSDVRSCYTIRDELPASRPQTDYAQALFRQHVPFEPWDTMDHVDAENMINRLDRIAISSFISKMTKQPFRDRTKKPNKMDPGIYKQGDSVFKVQKNLSSTGLYYKEWIWFNEEKTEGNFVYRSGRLYEIGDATKLSVEEMKEWGQLYGYCCICGRRLTDERSIEIGIGPICLSKQGV